ncbi:MAG: hypothetical protein KY476_13265 [Planctomycetes bacterium]|nr:hypothetical protein [Planctomycetota bacterium]
MLNVKATFDGRAFVPTQAVDVPVGTEVEVRLPTERPAKPPQQDAEWQAVLEELAATEPVFPTVEEALQRSRKRA